MRKIISVCLMLALVLSLPVAVFAAGAQVKFTSASTFKVGGSAEVDVLATCSSVMDGNPTSDMYNAALEQNIDVMWRCSNGPDKYGNPITWTADDAGKEYVCRVSFYADKAKTEFVDYIDANELSKIGLTLAKNGVLSGTPKKAGSYTFTICAANEQGEDYATYTLIVKEAAETPLRKLSRRLPKAVKRPAQSRKSRIRLIQIIPAVTVPKIIPVI